ncbi:FMRFamide receptor-like [Argonauta hians]
MEVFMEKTNDSNLVSGSNSKYILDWNVSHVTNSAVLSSSSLSSSSLSSLSSPLSSSSSSPPLPTLSKEVKMVEFYLTGVASIVIISLGLIGNILTIAVLTKRAMHSSTNCYLKALAMWDSVVLIITLFLIGIPSVSEPYRKKILPYVIVYAYPAGLIGQTATIWLTVSFTVERYIAVCHPLRAASMCTIARARIVIFSVSLFSFIYNASRWFEYEIECHYDPIDKTLHVERKTTELGESKVYRTVYFLCLYLPIMCFIPLTSLAVINIFLILAVKRSQRQRRDMNVRQSRENNVTLMLVSVVIVFMICQVPALIYNTAYAIDSERVSNRSAWIILSFIRNYLVTLNSAINFLLYCALGQKFRRIFIRTFCRCWLPEEDFSSLTYNGTVVNPHTTLRGGGYSKAQKLQVTSTDQGDATSSTTTGTHLTILSTNSSHSSFETNAVYRKNAANKHEPATKITKYNGEELLRDSIDVDIDESDIVSHERSSSDVREIVKDMC